MKSDFEAHGGVYRPVGGFLDVPAVPQIGVWGHRRREYLRLNHKTIYTAMLLGGTLDAHLEEIDRAAEVMFSNLVAKFVAQERITDRLKAKDQLAWVGSMNNIRSRATEIVNSELIQK